MAWQRGWVGKSWRCLRTLWTIESRWDHRARNPSSGAEGIAQELGHGPVSPTPRGQIRWGLTYVAARYHGPCHALAFHRARGYY